MISLKTHNIMDYVGGALLILMPFIFGFADLNNARGLFMFGGFFLILYSLFTNYEFAVARLLPLGVHMTLDVLLGAVIFLAPWMFGYRTFLSVGQEWLHYLLGLGVIALVGMTREKTEADKRQHGLTFRSASGL